MLSVSPASSFSSSCTFYSLNDDPIDSKSDVIVQPAIAQSSLRSSEFQQDGEQVNFDRESIPSRIVRENHLELAKSWIENGCKPRIAAGDMHFATLTMRDLLARHMFRQELMTTNANHRFWQALDDDTSQAYCCHSHGQGASEQDCRHIAINGNFLIAQKKISQAIDVVFSDAFNPNNPTHRYNLFMLSALNKAQDQLSGGKDFISRKSHDFNLMFGIIDSIRGRTIHGETRAMPDGRDYLVNQFGLHRTWKKIERIRANGSNLLKQSRDIVNLTWKTCIDLFIGATKSGYKVCPSFFYTFCIVGAIGLVFRSIGDQKSADSLRNNMGASAELAAFFLVVNGVLENLSHSLILAAPAFIAVAVYDKTYVEFKKIYNFFSHNAESAKNTLVARDSGNEFDRSIDRDIDLGIDLEAGLNTNMINGSFCRTDAEEVGNILKRTQSFLNENEMWAGLRKWQAAYQDNPVESELKDAIQNLIDELHTSPASINALLQQDFNQALNDSHALLTAYADVYQKKNPGSSIHQLLHDFCDTFARDGILLAPPSNNAKIAAFYCRAHFGLIAFETRLQASLPHAPSGEQVVLAMAAIVMLFAGSAIYEKVTGHKEMYTTYATNFPDHIFDWLQLDTLYANLGGGAEIADIFKELFAGFNLFENSTHLGIAIAPLIAYLQMGSRMFEGLHHQPANFLAYLGYSLINSVNEMVKTRNAFPDHLPPSSPQSLSAPAVAMDDVENNIVIDQNTAEERGPELEEKGVEEEKLDQNFMFCGSGPEFFAQFQNQQNGQNLAGKLASSKKKRFRPVHQHGKNCQH